MKRWLGILLTTALALLLLTPLTALAEELPRYTLNIDMPTPIYTEQLEKLVADFIAHEKANGKDVEVQLIIQNEDESKAALRAKLVSGDAPDIFKAHGTTELPDYARAGYLMDLSDQPWVETYKDDVRQMMSMDDKVYGMFIEAPMWGYIYNRQIFRDLDLEIPLTFSDLMKNVEIMEKNGINPFMLSYKTAYCTRIQTVQALPAVIIAKQIPDWYERMNKGEASYAEMQEQIFNFVDFTNAHGNENALDIDISEAAARFVNGEAAMWVMVPSIGTTIKGIDPDFEFGMAPLPVDDNPEHTGICKGYGTTFVASANTKVPEIVQDFFAFMMSEEYTNSFFQSMNVPPTSSLHTYDMPSWMAEAASYVDKGMYGAERAWPRPILDESMKIMQEYYLKQVSADEVVEMLDQIWATYVETHQQ